MRCSAGAYGCGRRFRLRRLPDAYRHSPRCPHCGSRIVYLREQERQQELARRPPCRCHGLPYPHHQAHHVLCLHHPDAAPDDPAWWKAREEAWCQQPRGSIARGTGTMPVDDLHVGLGIRRSQPGGDEPPF